MSTPNNSQHQQAVVAVAESTTTTTTTTTNSTTMQLSPEEATAKTMHKRYEGLVMVRTKAVKGKGAWYWQHLEPILVHNHDTGFPKAVKLRCSLCDAVFSASNPSRTASEHLKRGTCPNFNSVALPISVGSPAPPPAPPPAAQPPPRNHQQKNHRKRSNSSSGSGNSVSVVELAYNPPVVSLATPVVSASTSTPTGVTITAGGGGGGGGVGTTTMYAQHQHQHQHQNNVMFSGGKQDFSALALLEDSVKKLKSPKASHNPTLSKAQINVALDSLAEWAYETCGSVSISSLEHPKFKAFLEQVGLPVISRKELLGSRLDAKYESVKVESEEKIRDAMFFQIASDGWKSKNNGNLVNVAINLPNGTNVFRRAVFTNGYVSSKYAEEVLWDIIVNICGNNVQQCVGIVSDKFKAKALSNLEIQHHWMVNLSCQYQAFLSLMKDFTKNLPLFKNVTENCLKLANFINNKSRIRHTFHRYQIQEYNHAGLLRVPSRGGSDYNTVHNMVEDIYNSGRALHLLLLDESYKIVSMEEPIGLEIGEMLRNPRFWNELEAIRALINLVKSIIQEIETEKPRIGQCLPLWKEIKIRVREWCLKFHVPESSIEKIIERRFNKNYHPAWCAAYILDPLYLIKDNNGKYLPPFKSLTPEQEKDVDKLITRLVSREEAPIALMELMKWRTEGLDPVYAQAVQVKERDPHTGKMKIAIPQSSRLVWETYLTEFKSLGKVAVRLVFLHATACGFKCNLSLLKWVNSQSHSRVAMDRAQKIVFIAAHSKSERGEYSKDHEDDDKNVEIFALTNGEDDVLNEVFVDTSSA